MLLKMETQSFEVHVLKFQPENWYEFTYLLS